MFNIENKSARDRTYDKFVDTWKSSMKEAYDIAKKHANINVGDEKKGVKKV